MISILRTIRCLAFTAVLVITSGAFFPATGVEFLGFKFFEPDANEPDVVDPHSYSISFRIEGIENDNSDARKIREASELFFESGRPTSGSAGLIRRAHEDYGRIIGALFDQGRYGGRVSILLAGQEAADITPIDKLPEPTQVIVRVDPGIVFRFGELRILPQAPQSTQRGDIVAQPATEGFQKGEAALAGRIRAAQELSVEAWRQQGHALAQVSENRIVADHETGLLDATLLLQPGPKLRFGETRITGSQALEPEFLIYMADLKQGEEFDPDDLEAAKRRFARLGVFRSVVVREEPADVADGEIPISMTLNDRKPRRIGFGGTISTIDGLGLEAFWMHRNLFGKAEQLRFDGKISGIDSADSPDEFEYFLGSELTFPGVLTPDTDLFFSLSGERSDFDTFSEKSVTAEAGLSHVFSPDLRGEAGFVLSRGRFDDDLGVRYFTTVGLQSSLTYDGRDSKTDPTGGYYFKIEAKPTYELEFSNLGIRGTIEGRAYRKLREDDSLILAGRLKMGSFFGSTVDETSPDNLFFAGGGNSIRGYKFNGIGVTNSMGNVVGGRSLLEGSIELRSRFNESFGGAAFVDFGIVDDSNVFAVSEKFLYGIGVGLRYYTVLGPIRFDLAVPQQKRSVDPEFAVYIGIGQSF